MVSGTPASFVFQREPSEPLGGIRAALGYQMKSNTPDLMKFKRLQRRLGESVRGVVGLLELMWLGVAKNCPRGNIGRFANEEIAIMVDFEGDPDQLVHALVECGWLDFHPEHRLIVHDWSEHAPSWVKGNVIQHMGGFIEPTIVTQRDPKEPPKDTPREPPRDGPQGASPADGPTKPNQVKPNQAKSSQETRSASADASPLPRSSSSVSNSFARDHLEILNVWNTTMGQDCRLTDKRVAALRLRLKNAEWRRTWRGALTKASESDFCRGRNDRGWTADFEWFIKPDSVTRLLEGKYDNRAKQIPANTAGNANDYEDFLAEALGRKEPTS